MARLRRVSGVAPGFRRRGRGRGFEYRDEEGTVVEDEETLARLRELAIPPAWTDVWICPDPLGHLQATGVDAAGRKQYLYHERWRAHRDREKFDRMVEFAEALPAIRRRVARDLGGGEPSRERVLAAAVRLLDLGFFRVGGEEYAEDNGSYGLATILKEHADLREDGRVSFDYPAKGGRRRLLTVTDPEVFAVVAELKRRRRGTELLAYRVGRRWVDVRSADINEYLKEVGGREFSAKDFRTWNASVLAAASLAVLGRDAGTATARKRVVSLAMREVARYLGNTPRVCRASYVDPRVIDRFEEGAAIEAPTDGLVWEAVERSVLDLIHGLVPSGTRYRKRNGTKGHVMQPRGVKKETRSDISSGRRVDRRSGTSRAKGPTRDQLYEEAKDLGIQGRSSMNKAQLRRAVDRRSGR